MPFLPLPAVLGKETVKLVPVKEELATNAGMLNAHGYAVFSQPSFWDWRAIRKWHGSTPRQSCVHRLVPTFMAWHIAPMPLVQLLNLPKSVGGSGRCP